MYNQKKKKKNNKKEKKRKEKKRKISIKKTPKIYLTFIEI